MKSFRTKWFHRIASLFVSAGFMLLTTELANAQQQLPARRGFVVDQDHVVARSQPNNPTPNPGEMITVGIFVDMTGVSPPDNRLAAYQANMAWNPSVLQFQSFTPGPAPWNNPIVNVASGTIEWNAFLAGGSPPADINILNVSFLVVGNIGTSTALTLNFGALVSAMFRDLRGILTVNSGTVNVGGVNLPPVLTPIANQTMNEGATLDVPISATDPNGNPLVLSTNNLPPFGNLSDNGDGTGFVRFMPGFNDAGIYANIEIIATDNATPPLSDTVAFTLTVNNVSVNRPPVLAPIANQTINEGETLRVQASANDPDGDTISLTAPNRPAFVAFTDSGNGNGTFVFTPGFNHAGNYPLSVIASDGALSDTVQFTLVVVNVNRPPVLAPVANQSVNEGDTLRVSVSASDPDGNGVSFSAPNLPAFGTLVPSGSGNATLTFMPGFNDAGVYANLRVLASDGALADTVEFMLTVANVNRPPVLDPIANQSMAVNTTLNVPVRAVDPDGNSITLESVNLPTFGALTDNGDGTGRITFSPLTGDAGIYPNIAVIAIDATQTNLQDTVTFTLTVSTVVQPLECTVEITSPDDSTVTCNDDSIRVCVRAQASGGVAPYTSVCQINGKTLPDSCAFVTLAQGQNLVVASCTFTDAAGTTCTSRDTIRVFASKLSSRVTLTSPQDSTFICANSINVGGTITATGGLGPITRTCTVNGNPVTVSGSSFGTTVALAAGFNTIVAAGTVSDSTGCASTSRDTIVVFSDATPPECTFNFDNLPVITGTAFDHESGIARIEIVESHNRMVAIAPFTIGDKVVTFSSEPIDPNERSSFTLRVTNRAGCSVLCDPVSLSLNPSQGLQHFAFRILSTDRYLFIDNQGLHKIEILLNERELNLVARQNGTGQDGNTYFIPFNGTRTIDISRYMLANDENQVEVRCEGPESSRAFVLFSDINVTGGPTFVRDVDRNTSELPATFALKQNYPNPFNPTTAITFEVPAGWSAPVTLSIMNVQGQIVQTLVDGMMAAGRHSVTWNSRDAAGEIVASGVYFYRIVSGDFVAVKRMILTK